MPGDHTSDTVAQAMIEAMKELPEHLRRSLTWDRGTELAKYKGVADLP
jgi:IS30 family transposase